MRMCLLFQAPIGHIGIECRQPCGYEKADKAPEIGKGKFTLPELVHFFEVEESIL